MGEPLDELRTLKTQLRELRWTTQVDSLEKLARESARGSGARGGISKATIGNVINPDNSTMPRWETYEIFIDTCLRLIDRAGAEPPADGGDRQTWRLRYIQVRDALGDNDEPVDTLDDETPAGFATPAESVAAEPDSVRDSPDTPARPSRPARRLAWLMAAMVLAVVVALVAWQVADDEPTPGVTASESASSFCAELGGKLVLADSFTDPNTGWPQHEGRSEYASGAYRLTAVAGTQVVHADAPIPASTNTCTEAVVRMESGFGGVALWCRGEPGDFARRYFFAVSNTGHWTIAMGQPAESRVALLATRDNLPGLNVERETRIGGSCRTSAAGVDLAISVNGHRMRYLDPDSQLTSGASGVLAWSWLTEPGTTSTALIEEIRIWELPSID